MSAWQDQSARWQVRDTLGRWLFDNVCDVWEPAENVQSDGSVYTATYTKTHAALACKRSEIDAKERMECGALDFTVPAAHFYVTGALLGVHHLAIFADLATGDYWQPRGVPQFVGAPQPGTDGYWRFSAEQLLAPPAEVSGG